MSLVVITALAVLAAAAMAVRWGHYIFAIAISLLSAYELLPWLLEPALEDEWLLQMLGPFGDYSSGQGLDGLPQTLSAFFAVFVVAYLLSGRNPKATVSVASSTGLTILPAVMLAFGVVSVMTGAGEASLQDYDGLGELNEPSRLFSYGAVLLVASTGIVLNKLSTKHVVNGLVIIVCVAPMVLELFLAGRRQWFAPSVLLVVLVVLYSRMRLRFVLAAGLVCVIAILFALQFTLRVSVQQGSTVFEMQPLWAAVLAPQLGEFVAIATITADVWKSFVTGPTPTTGGIHLALQVLNTIPFLKIGDTLFPTYAANMYRTYNELSPWGGFSMIADSIMALGAVGTIVLAISIGFLCRRSHEIAASVMRDGMPGDVRSVYYLSLIATLVLKYRSGVGDAIQSAVSFSVLYWSIWLLGYVLLESKVGIQSLRYPTDQTSSESNVGGH